MPNLETDEYYTVVVEYFQSADPQECLWFHIHLTPPELMPDLLGKLMEEHCPLDIQIFKEGVLNQIVAPGLTKREAMFGAEVQKEYDLQKHHLYPGQHTRYLNADGTVVSAKRVVRPEQYLN